LRRGAVRIPFYRTVELREGLVVSTRRAQGRMENVSDHRAVLVPRLRQARREDSAVTARLPTVADVPRLRIAVDVQFSPDDAPLFASKGIDIVVWAQPGEMDASWLARAKLAGVDLICSPDADAQIFAYDNRIHFIRTRKQRSRADRFSAVMSTWRRLRATGALP
jgi:hypothetical protein